MFINPSFENGHWYPNRENIIGGWHYPILEEAGIPIPELMLPNGWGFRWADETVENPHSPDSWNRFGRPETKVLNENDLPEHERPDFIVHGSHTLKIFRGYGAWYAALFQEFEFEDGLYQVHVNIYNDAVKDYEDSEKLPAVDPYACQVRLVIDGEPSEWRPLFPQYMNTETFLFTAYASEEKTRVEVEIMMSYAVQNSGIFTDLWDLVEIYRTIRKVNM